MYAFNSGMPAGNGWQLYNVAREFKRQGVGSSTRAWRFSSVNASYEMAPTYPSMLVVPSNISDMTLIHAAKHRSKGRIPVLTYLHWANLATLSRSSQPMVGITQNRSIQDEKLVEAIFSSHERAHGLVSSSSEPVYGSTMTNLIVDARPTANAMANHARGAGSENMEFYKNCKKVYLGIDNIHVMRDSLAKIQTALRLQDERPVFEARQEATVLDELALQRSQWLKHLGAVLQGTRQIVQNIHIHSSHVLVHCSDGWDRTAQLVSLAQICLDPYFRTLEGFAVLIEKDWVSFGHQFQERHGLVHQSSSKFDMRAPQHDLLLDAEAKIDEVNEEQGRAAPSLWDFTKSLTAHFQGHASSQTAPIFFQFLDCVWQLQCQFPERFEFRGSYLTELVRQAFSGTSGTFLYNSERERRLSSSPNKPAPAEMTPSAWDALLSDTSWKNPRYDPSLDRRDGRDDQGVLYVEPKDVRFASDLFRRSDDSLNAHLDAERRQKVYLQQQLAESVHESRPKALSHQDPLFPEETFHNAARKVRSLFSDGWNRVQEAVRKTTDEANVVAQRHDSGVIPTSDSNNEPSSSAAINNPWIEQTNKVRNELDSLSSCSWEPPPSSTATGDALPPSLPRSISTPEPDAMASTDPLGASYL